MKHLLDQILAITNNNQTDAIKIQTIQQVLSSFEAKEGVI